MGDAMRRRRGARRIAEGVTGWALVAGMAIALVMYKMKKFTTLHDEARVYVMRIADRLPKRRGGEPQ